VTAEAFPQSSTEPSIRDLIEAVGGLAAVLAVHLDREGVATTTEIAGHLGVFASITDETSPMAGSILAYWSEVIGQALTP
jgi:hypothetical protein